MDLSSWSERSYDLTGPAESIQVYRRTTCEMRQNSNHTNYARISLQVRALKSPTMKSIRRTICCSILGIAVLSMTAKVNAQSDNDKKFLATAAQSDVNEIKLSQLAEQKATNPAMKAFAQKMVAEHNKMSMSMQPFAASWGVAPPTDMDADHQKEYEKLNGLSGGDFDKEYIDQMVTDHAKALDAFSTEAKDTKDAKFRAAVLKGKAMVAAHKNMAYDLKKKL